jgi:hypothetical protein
VGRSIDENWLGRTLNAWRSPLYSHRLPIEPIAEVIGRLCHSNPSTPRPILVMDLDAIDEIPINHRSVAARVINHFWKLRRSGLVEAVLLVTCRTPGQSSDVAIQRLLGEWLDSDIPHKLADTVGVVFVGDFEVDELGQAAKVLGGDYERRCTAISASQELGHMTDILGQETYPPGASRAVKRAMYESLRHPAMWGTFVELLPERRHQVLDEDPSALSELAEGFLKRFSMKANRRLPVTRDRIERALREVSALTPDNPSDRTRQKHWISPAQSVISPVEAGELYDEAISYGLIFGIARDQWMWRHIFVCDYLKGL